MRKYLTIAIIVVIIYNIFLDKKTSRRASSEKISTETTATQQSSESAKSVAQEKTEDTKISENSDKDKETQKSGAVERVLSNAMSSFLQSPVGVKFAKTMLTVKDKDLKTNSVAFATNGFSALKREYQVETLTLPVENIRSVCGQKILLNYIVLNKDGKEIKTEDVEYRIGSSEIEELNILTPGLRINEAIRANFLSKQRAEGKEDSENYKIIMVILKHLTALDADYSKIKIFDDYITTSRPVICGDNVKFHYKVLKINGDTIDDNLITFKVGDNNYPQVLSHIIENMPTIGSRTVILPEKYLHNKNKKRLFNIKDSSSDYVILEINGVSISPKSNIE